MSEQVTDHEESKGLYYTKKEPKKSFATFQRNQNKLYVNSFNMIDRKAAIMIRVNATIISAVVIFFEKIKDIDFGMFIGVAMVIFSFISLLFAVNASRPHSFSIHKKYRRIIRNKYKNLKENIFFVGVHNKTSLEDYENAYSELVKSQDLQIGNQIRSQYIMEKQIGSCFIQLEISYFSFLLGFIITVIAFVWANIKFAL